MSGSERKILKISSGLNEMYEDKEPENKIWDDVHDIAVSIISVALNHKVPVSYIWNMLSQTTQKMTFKLAEESEWIRDGTCCICGDPATIRFHRHISDETQWFCVKHGHMINDLLATIADKQVIPDLSCVKGERVGRVK
jgi:hypothetical protein